MTRSLLAANLRLLPRARAEAGTRVGMRRRRDLRGVRAPPVAPAPSMRPRPVEDGWIYGSCAFDVPR